MRLLDIPMKLLDRFSTHLRDVLARSIQLAGELNNPLVEPIHLFFTLSNQKGSVAAEIITRFKISPKIMERALVGLPNHKETNRANKTTAERVLTPLASATKAALEKAMIVAEENNHNFIGTEHLLTALTHLDDHLINEIFKISGVSLADLKKQIDTVLSNASHFPKMNEMTEVAEHLQEHLHEHSAPEEMTPVTEMKQSRKKESALDFFATHLTDPKTQQNIDPVIGREREIERVIHIICRRTKNNPLLLGDPGVGKTAIVEGLAKRILEGQVPEMLLNKKIYALDMGLLIAGTIYRGEFEARLRQVIEETISNPSIILFIDEIHNIVGAGSNQGTMDAANILKPALARGQIRCIGATTPVEFKKYIENDAALERRFQPVYAKEPSQEDTINILRGIKNNYEAYHQVAILDEALVAAARLSERYISGKFLPDKAIDLIDETSAAKRLTVKSSGIQSKLFRLEQKLEKTITAKETAASQDKFKAAVEFKKEEEALVDEINNLTRQAKKKKLKVLATVTARDIAEQITKVIGTLPAELILDDTADLMRLEEKLRSFVVGQDEVINEVSQHIRQAKLGLSNPERPLASFLFVGESGVGKTELGKTLATVLYGGSDALIKLDMSEFNESFGVSKLLGSPAGYIGYKEGNQFSDKIKLHPYSVVLFDEIDKAHKDIVKLLLQILENGEITDATGKKISLRHCIIILTTSYGAAQVKKGMVGFDRATQSSPETKTRLVEKLKEFFSPEIINRLDKICLFEPLTPATLVSIAELELKRFNERLKNYHTELLSTHEALEWVVAELPERTKGAREVRRWLRSRMEMLMSNIIINHKVKNKYILSVADNTMVIK